MDLSLDSPTLPQGGLGPGKEDRDPAPILTVREGAMGRRPTIHFLPRGPESLPLPTLQSHESPLARFRLLEKPFPLRMEVEVEWTGPGRLGS